MARVTTRRHRRLHSPKFSCLLCQNRLLRVEVAQLARREEELGGELAKVRQEFDLKLEDVLFEHDYWQVHLDSVTSHLLAVRNSLMAVRKGFVPQCECWATSYLWLESLLSSSICNSVDIVACLVSGEVAAHRPRLTNVVASASSSLLLELQSVVELILAVKRGGQVFTTNQETSGTPSFRLLVPGDD